MDTHTIATAKDPDWIRESWQESETRQYLLTLREVCSSPRRFAREWADGARSQAMKPVRFLLLSLAVDALWYAVLIRTLALNELSFWRNAVNTLRPYLLIIFYAAALHFLLRRRGGRPYRSTLGVVFYVAGGPLIYLRMAAISLTATTAVLGGQTVAAEHHFALLALIGAAQPILGGLMVVYYAFALSGLHERRWYVSLLVAIVVLGSVSVLQGKFAALGHPLANQIIDRAVR